MLKISHNSQPSFSHYSEYSGFLAVDPGLFGIRQKKNIRIRYSDFKILIFGFGFEVPNTRYSGRILGIESISLHRWAITISKFRIDSYPLLASSQHVGAAAAVTILQLEFMLVEPGSTILYR